MEQNGKENRALTVAPSTALQKPPPPGYWARVCAAYKQAFRGLLIALPIFAVVFMITCPQAFSYDSVFGFAKDLQSAASFVSHDYRTVTYTYAQGESCTVAYRGGLASVNGQGIEVYSPDGERTLDVPLSFAAPRAAASRKYLLAYDFGSTTFTVTNAYSRLFWADTDFPIYMGEVGESGRFALVTGSDTYLSEVLLYDANFNVIQRFGRASATTGLSISANGRYLAISGIYSETGSSGALLELYRIGAQAPSFSVRLEGEVALDLSFTDNRHIALTTDRALRVFDLGGECESKVLFDGASVREVACNEYGCAVVLEKDVLDMKQRVILTGKRGSVLQDTEFDGDVRAISLGERALYLLFEGRAERLDAASGERAVLNCAAGALNLHAVDSTRVRVAYAAQAIYLNFEEN